MVAGAQQQRLVVLSVDVDQVSAQLSEHRRGGSAAVDGDPPLAGARDLAAYDDRLVVAIETERVDPLLVDGEVEHPLDGRLVGAAAQQLGAGAVAA